MLRRLAQGLAAIALVGLTLAVAATQRNDQPSERVSVVFDGQSLNNAPPPPDNYPSVLMAAEDVIWSNVAITGTSWTDLSATAASRLYPKATAELNILIMSGGTSDILAGDAGQQLYEDEVAYARGARTAGFDIVIATTLVGNGINNADQDAARLDHNALLLADAEKSFDDVADLAATALADWTDSNFYTIDHLHWKAAGAQLAADTVAPVLLPLIR